MDDNLPTASQPAWYDDFLRRILDGMANATQAIQQAALLYVEAIDKDPAFRDFIVEKCPEVSGSVWRNLERVGRGQLDARIASGGCSYGNKLRRLPMSEQKQALDGTLPLLTSTGDTLQVRLDALLPRQAEQVFANGHIRSLSEQRAWLEAQAQEAAAAAQPVLVTNPVEIDKRRRRIIVNVGGVALTAADLADYLRKISE